MAGVARPLAGRRAFSFRPRDCGNGPARGDRSIRLRKESAYWVAIVHRLSGIALAAFLPLHFWVLGSAIEGAARLQSSLAWTEQPLVKLGEWAIVLALAAHLGGGLRVLALELLPWREWQKGLAAGAAALALAVGLAFALAL
ncbi:MAG: succinate dehydrogenase, cytochrome b556 subunit [Burkholderiales bacterium]